MKLAGLCLVLLAACGTQSVGGDDYPVIGGGGGVGGTAGSGGGGGGGDGSTGLFTGKICLVTDPRNLRTDVSSCATTGAGGLTVVADDGTTSDSATTAQDGSFALNKPTGSVTFKVSGGNVITSYMADGYSMNIPVIKAADYAKMKTDNTVASFPETPNVGDLMVRVQMMNGAGAATYTGFATPAGSYQTIYDATTGWTTTMLGANGTAWVAAIAPGPETFTVDLHNNNMVAMNNLVVHDQAITFAQMIMPF